MITFAADNWVWVVLACSALAVFAWVYYRRTIPPLALGIGGVLRVLRFVAIIALFLSMAEALFSYEEEQARPGTVIALIDRSASMEQTDGVDRPSRWERAGTWVEDHLASRPLPRPDLLVWSFGDSLEVPALDDTDVPFAQTTALGDALAALGDAAGDENLLGVCLLSDGAANRGVDAADAAQRLAATGRVPIWAVGVGHPVGTSPARIAQADAPNVVYVDRPFEIVARLESGPTADVTVRLRRGGRTIDRQRISAQSEGGLTEFRFETSVPNAGRIPFTLDVLDADGRPDTLAARSFFVHALPSKLRVLLRAYRTDWEFAYLRRFLGSSERIELTTALRGPEGGSTSRAAVPTPGAFDLVVFLSPSRDDLRDDWAPYAEAFLTGGTGAVFVLGEEYARSAGASAAFPLEFVKGVLPVARGEFLGVVSGVHRNHPLARLGSGRSTDSPAWEELPPFTHIVRLPDPPGDAAVMISAAVAGQSPGRVASDPIVITRTHRGGGRALVLAAGAFWKWAAQRVAEGMPPVEYQSFWESAVRWLTVKDDSDRQGLVTDREVYHAGEPIALSANLFDEAYRFIAGAKVSARVWPVTDPDQAPAGTIDTIPIFLPLGEGERYSATLRNLEPGQYALAGAAVVVDDTIALAGPPFRVEPFGLETVYSAPDFDLLRRIADRSGGRFYTESERPGALDSLVLTPRIDRTTREVPLWPQTWLLVVFVGVLSAEWWIRRRKQLL